MNLTILYISRLSTRQPCPEVVRSGGHPQVWVGRSLLHCAYSLDHPDPLEMRLLFLRFHPPDEPANTLGVIVKTPEKA